MIETEHHERTVKSCPRCWRRHGDTGELLQKAADGRIYLKCPKCTESWCVDPLDCDGQQLIRRAKLTGNMP